jgi:EAL domain-containing protein (putative c-di-GMP-specific phosphodiesterase class I)
MHAAVLRRLSLVQDLHIGLERTQFELYLQPKINLATGKLAGAEALIRWQHPERGLVPPAEFIATCEESGLIIPLGNWILRRACALQTGWRAAGLPAVPLAVNVSGLQFSQTSFVELIGEVIAESGILPSDLELELTESILIGNAESAVKRLQAIRSLGVAVSIDDFGTGYSSLNYLKRFPVDTLKIDMSFIRNLPTDPTDATIVSAIVNIARSLNLQTIAEGVETDRHRDILRDMGCHQAQGYFYDRPAPPADFATRWLGTAAPQ